VTEDRDSQDNPQGADDGTGDLPGRDLGVGHPLSADADGSGQPPPSDIDATLPADNGDTHLTGVTDTDEPPADGTQRSEESGVSRRSLLLGGAAGAVAASLGWAAVLGAGGGGGPDGAAEVAVDYVNAIADNDWAAAGALFHEQSEFRQEANSYETFLDERQQLETFTRITPSVESHLVRFHVPDTEAATEADAEFSLPGDVDPATVDEWKQVRVAASFRTENLDTFENDSGVFAETVTLPFNVSLVLDGDWQIISTGGTIPQFLF